MKTDRKFPEAKAVAAGVPVFCDHTALVETESLRPNPRNPNKHPADQIRLLAKNIAHLGWRHAITVSTRSKCIVAGHGRLMAAQALKLDKVPVDFQHFATDADEYAVLIADNRLAELAETDRNILKELAGDLEGELGLKDSELAGFTEEEWEKLMMTGAPSVPEHLNDTPDAIDKTLSKRGDLFQIVHGGRAHAVLCGDSSSIEDMQKLLVNNKATIIWAKDSLVLSRKDYHTQYEPIWYGWNGEAARLVEVQDRKQSDLWQIPRPKKSEEHPTMKPVELVARALANSSLKNAIVLDGFGGSGTTMIAAEHVGRASFLVELDPRYVDVIVKRFLAAYPDARATLGDRQVTVADFPKTEPTEA